MLFTAPKLPQDYLNVCSRIDALREKLNYTVQPRRWAGLLRRQQFARAIQGSNSIEGYNVTHEDAVAAVENEQPLDTNTETWMAVSGYRAAMSYILQLADDPYYIHNEGTLRSLHYIMIGYDLKKHPGRWRPGTIYVRHEPSGDIVYEGPDVDLVPRLMKELIDSLNAKSNLPCLVRAAMAHLNLVMIHPFSDGNGRMARALQTMVLSRDGISDPRLSSIEEYLGANTLEYYAILTEVGKGAWHPENDPLPWVRFCLKAHYRQAETILRRSREMSRLADELESQLMRKSMNDRMIFALIDAAFGYRVRNSTYRAIAEISDEVASKDLRALVVGEMLTAHGEKRARYYVASEWLKAQMDKVREKKIVTDPFTEISVVEPGPQQPSLPGL